jgi:hypothetical protein
MLALTSVITDQARQPSQSRPQNVFNARRQKTDGNEIPLASDARAS